jgi:fatty-acyl-CoA synthase
MSCHQNIRYTYRGLLHHVNRAARALLRLGVERGDRVGISGPSRVRSRRDVLDGIHGAG